MERLQRIAIGNGLLVVLAAMFAGLMLMFSLLGGWELWPGNIFPIPAYGTSEGWVRAHSGGVTNGILLIVIGLALPKLGLSAAMQRLMAYGFICVAWGFTAFYWFGNAAGSRALTLGSNPLGETDIYGVLGFIFAAPPVFLVIFLLAVGAKGILLNND